MIPTSPPVSTPPWPSPAPSAESPSLRTLHQLLNQLKQGDFQTRWAAMKALVKLGDQAIDPLLACLGELAGEPTDDRGQRAQPAKTGLGTGHHAPNPQPSAGGDSMPADGLADRETVAALRAAEDDEEDEDDNDGWELPWFIAQTLGQIQHPRAITALVHLVQSYSVADNAPPRSLDVAQVAATALAQLGSTALPALQALTAHPATRLYGVQALAQMRDPKVVDDLLGVTQDPSVPIRALAFEALSGFLDPRIAPIFAQGLADPSPQVRQRAIVGVSLRSTALDSQWLLQHLAPLVWDLNLSVACQAATALGRMGHPDSVTVLAEVLDQPTAPPLQQAALQSLCLLATDRAFAHLDRYIQTYLASPSDRPLDPMRNLLGYLGQLEAPSAQRQGLACLTQFLAQTLGQPQHNLLKQRAASSLGQLGRKLAPTLDPQTDRTLILYPLIHLLADPDLGVRFHAIAALKQCNAPLALHCLQEWQAAPPATAPDLSPEAALRSNEALQAGIACALAEWNQ